MQDDHPGIEPGFKASDGLRRQADLGYQHQDLSTSGQVMSDELQVDFCFSAPGDTPDEAGLMFAHWKLDEASDDGSLFISGCDRRCRDHRRREVLNLRWRDLAGFYPLLVQ